MQGRRLLYLIPVVLFVSLALFLGFGLSPNQTASADTPSLALGNSFEREYGEFILDKSVWTYDATGDVFISYGNVEEGKYVPMSVEPFNQSGECYAYKCRLNLFIVDPNGEIVGSGGNGRYSKPYDQNGLCTLKPGAKYKVSSARIESNTTTDGVFAVLNPLTVVDGNVTEGETEYLDYYSVSDLSINVKQRSLTVDIDQENSTGVDSFSTGEIDSEGYYPLTIGRTYAIATSLAFTGDKLAFDHKFEPCSLASSNANGMYVYDNVGDYDPFFIDGNIVKIVDGSGNDVTEYYKIVSKYKLDVAVSKLKIVAPVYDFTDIYKQDCIDIEDVVFSGDNAEILSSGYDLKNNNYGSSNIQFNGREQILHYMNGVGELMSNEALAVAYSYKICAVKNNFYPAIDPSIKKYSLYVNESNQNPDLTYDCLPVLVSVHRADSSIDLSNFEIVPLDGYSTTLKIEKKSIVLYAEGAETSYPPEEFIPAKGESFISVSSESFSNPYGLAYNERSTTSVFVDTTGNGVADTEITITFKIKRFAEFLSDTTFYKFGSKVILNKGEYAIEPEEIDDWRYDATIHRSLHYTVTPKQITMAELFAENSFVNSVELIDGVYVIKDFEFDSEYSAYKTVELKFNRKLPDNGDGEYITEDPVFSMYFSFNENALPGIYPSCGIYDNDGAIVYNYDVTDLMIGEGVIDNIAMRINRKQLVVSVADKEYDGGSIATLITGETEGSPYNATISYCKGSTYNESKKLKSAPVDAGDYVVRVSLEEGSIYSFVADKDFIDVHFTIEKRKVTVTVASKGEKTFGVEGYFRSPTDSNIATYSVAYTLDPSVPALIGRDSLGSLSSNGAVAGAKPSTYDIDVSGIKHANYEIAFEYASGGRKETITVTKLKTDDLLKKYGKSIKQPDPHAQSILLSNFNLLGNVVSVKIEYEIEGTFVSSNVKTNSDGYEITGLSEGTYYRIRYVLPKNNDFADLGKDYVICEFTVSTILTAPDWFQNFDKAQKDNIFININNYEEDKYFVYIEADGIFENGFTFDIPSSCIEKVFDPDDETTLLYVIFDLGKALSLSAENTEKLGFGADMNYSLSVMRKTEDIALEPSDVTPQTVFTKADKPTIKKADIEIKSTTITVKLPSTEDETLTYVIKYIVGETGKQTIASLVEDLDLTEKFIDPDAEILDADGAMMSDLMPDTIYYVMIYAVRSVDVESIAEINGEPIYFELHTPKSNWENVKAVEVLEKISGYFGVSMVGVLLIVLIILCVRYSAIKRKWRIE